VSSGAERDLVVLFVCYVFLLEALEGDCIDEDIVSIYSKINRTLAPLPIRLKGRIQDKGRSKLNSLKLGNTANLELLAYYVLLINFSEQAKTLHPILEPYRDAEQYLTVLDKIVDTQASILEREMYQAAYEVISHIKG
jgi:hypothetical protein